MGQTSDRCVAGVFAIWFLYAAFTLKSGSLPFAFTYGLLLVQSLMCCGLIMSKRWSYGLGIAYGFVSIYGVRMFLTFPPPPEEVLRFRLMLTAQAAAYFFLMLYGIVRLWQTRKGISAP